MKIIEQINSVLKLEMDIEELNIDYYRVLVSALNRLNLCRRKTNFLGEKIFQMGMIELRKMFNERYPNMQDSAIIKAMNSLSDSEFLYWTYIL